MLQQFGIRLWLAGIVVGILVSQIIADDARQKSESEPFPHSAKIVRDRVVDPALESARVALSKSDFVGAITVLQSLLDGQNVFVGSGAQSRSVVAEANRLLAEMPPVGRDTYERLQGATAERLRQETLRSGDRSLLRSVVLRFGPSKAGWQALRELAAWHFDRGEWRLVAASCEELARHPRMRGSQDTSFYARWLFAVEQLDEPERSVASRPLELLRSQPWFAQAPAPPGANQPNLSRWLQEQLHHARPDSAIEAAQQPTSWTDGPAAIASWRLDCGLAPASSEWFEQIVGEWTGYDILPAPVAEPLWVGDKLIARFAMPPKIVAIDVREGRIVWERTPSQSALGLESELQRHPGIRTSLFDELQRRWFGDSIRGRMTTDGRRVFAVTDPDSLDLKPGAGTLIRNHLEALDVATGERVWRIGGSQKEPPSEFQGLFFLGPPLVSRPFVYVVAQRELVVYLLALRADDGELAWSLPLAETDRQQFKETSWRHIACPVTWSEGLLICPTAAGCFVAVDPVTRSLVWSFRLEREDILSALGFGVVDRERSFPVRWWESWRETMLLNLPNSVERKRESSSTLILATPESRSLRALNARTGELRWRHEFREPLFLATDGVVSGGKRAPVLILERNQATALEPDSGQVRWQVTIPEPAAAGGYKDGRYVFPLRNGGWATIDADGIISQTPPFEGLKPQSSKLGSTVVSGRLFQRGRHWVELSPVKLQIFESLTARRETLSKRRATKPDDLEARLEEAWLEELTGDPAHAEELLRSASEPKSSAEVAGAALRQLRLRQLERTPQMHSGVEAELLSLSREVVEQIETRHALIEAAIRARDFVTALRRVLDLAELHPANEVVVEAERPLRAAEASRKSPLATRRTVSHERWLQGVVADLFAVATAEERPRLESTLAARQQKATDSLDPFALQQFANTVNKLPAGQRLALALSGRLGVGPGYVRTNLALREVSGSGERTLSAEAFYRLALLHEFRSEPMDAADCYRELRERFADVTLADGRAVSTLLADVDADSTVGRMLAQEPRDPWPAVTPKIPPHQDEPHDDIYCYLVPVESRDPFWRRLSVLVERQGRKVRFHGAGQRGFWELPLPKSNSPFRHNFFLYRGWGLGPVLVLQVGRELFGIQPLNDRGEPDPQLLWTLTLPDIDEIGGQEVRLARPGISTDDWMLLDRYEHPVLEVLVARPGVVCYRHRNQLVAIDPATGGRLWTKHLLAPRTLITGDDEVILVQASDSTEVEVLRSFDGRVLARHADQPLPHAWSWAEGRWRFRVMTTAQASVLVCDDVADNRTRWQRNAPAGSSLLRVDDTRLGLLEPGGSLRFLSLKDGAELAAYDVSLPKSLTHSHAFGDELRLFVLVAGPVTERSWLATEQDRGAYRKPLVNGWLHAFDRRSLQKLWTINTGNLPMALDQPKDVPFLLFPYRRPSDDSADGLTSDGVLHLIDKRTGKELLFEPLNSSSTHVTLDPNPQEERVDLLTKSRRLRLQFESPSPQALP